MTDWNQKAAIEKLNVWVQTFGILVASVWAAYTFVYKEITVPASAPVNISIDLKFHKSGPRADRRSTETKPLTAIGIEASITNPSSRTVELLPSAFVVWGINYSYDENQQFDAQIAANAVAPYSAIYLVRHSPAYAKRVIAIGNLIRDSVLKPSEIVNRTLLVHIPDGEYDALEMIAVVPSARDTSGLALEWQFTEDGGLTPSMYRVSEDGMRTTMEADESGGYSDERVDLQQASSFSMFSLW